MPKIINILFFSLILLLPSQLGKHWWPEWSLVDGVRVDYLSPTIYLTDVLLFLLLISIFINHILSLRGALATRQSPRLPRSLRSLAMTGAFYILFIILRTPRPWLAVYWLARYLEIPLVAFLIIKMRRIRGERRIRREIIIALAIAVLFSVGLGVVQMVLGRTTGWFWWLGERTFTAATPGVATMTILGREILRPYATFGHPNALGGFVAAATMILIGKKDEGRRKKEIRELLKLVLIFIGVLGVILTGSRGAIAALAAGAIVKFQILDLRFKNLSFRIFGILGILGGLGIWGNLGNAVKFAGEAGEERLILAQAAGNMWKENRLMGVGAGQFLAKLPDYLPDGFWKIQPVHNVFLLVLAEFGVGGGLIWLIWLIGRIKRKERVGRWLPVLTVIFVTGMVDHYWLTGQQNRLLLGMILGLMISTWGRRSIYDSGLRLRSKWQYPDGKKAQGGQSGVRPG